MLRISLLVAALFSVVPATAEFHHIEITFQGTDCISCTESLESRLARVRGVSNVALDLDKSTVTLELEDGNKVRLAPLLSRITQDGTAVLRTKVVATGTIEGQGNELRFHPTGLRQACRLRMAEGVAPPKPGLEMGYKVRGVVSEVEPLSEPLLEASSIDVVTGDGR